MPDGLSWIIALLLLLLLDLACVGALSAYSRTNHARLLGLRDEVGSERLDQAIDLLMAMPRLKASLNLTLSISRFSIAGLLLGLYFWTLGTSSIYILAGLLAGAALLMFSFEWLVERKVGRNPEPWALRFSGFIRVSVFLTAWLVAIPFLLTKDNANIGEIASSVTEDELKIMVDAGEENGVLEQEERRMIFSIFRLGETLAREIMVPRIDMLALEVHVTLDEAVGAFLNSGHSRIPVYEETIDNLLGVLYAKDLLRIWHEASRPETLKPLLRPAYFVPEAKKVDELLAEMQKQRIHIAFVVDEYGGIAGLVTLEDIVEEIIGEIRDEYDQGEEMPFQELKEGEYIFQGRIDLDDFNELMKTDLPKEDADTLGGYIYNTLGRVPEVGETIERGRLLLTVEQVSGRRIRKVRARRISEEKESGNE